MPDPSFGAVGVLSMAAAILDPASKKRCKRGDAEKFYTRWSAE